MLFLGAIAGLVVLAAAVVFVAVGRRRHTSSESTAKPAATAAAAVAAGPNRELETVPPPALCRCSVKKGFHPRNIDCELDDGAEVSLVALSLSRQSSAGSSPTSRRCSLAGSEASSASPADATGGGSGSSTNPDAVPAVVVGDDGAASDKPSPVWATRFMHLAHALRRAHRLNRGGLRSTSLVDIVETYNILYRLNIQPEDVQGCIQTEGEGSLVNVQDFTWRLIDTVKKMPERTFAALPPSGRPEELYPPERLNRVVQRLSPLTVGAAAVVDGNVVPTAAGDVVGATAAAEAARLAFTPLAEAELQS